MGFVKKLEAVESSLSKGKSVDDTREALLALIHYMKGEEFRRDVAFMVLDFPLSKISDLFVEKDKKLKSNLDAQARRTKANS